jgi:hypothetical protein
VGVGDGGTGVAVRTAVAVGATIGVESTEGCGVDVSVSTWSEFEPPPSLEANTAPHGTVACDDRAIHALKSPTTNQLDTLC